ncbi:MAG TPA: hypothetical protein VI461_10265, partial [Chitinophagaceae bacterium]|nr:hypothetical protein [Chitinophagaceae bacterium]
MKILSLNALYILLVVSSGYSQPGSKSRDDAAILHRAEKALTDVIVHDIFSPPVASRIYVYANIAAYEVLVKADDSCKSLYGLLPAIPDIASP